MISIRKVLVSSVAGAALLLIGAAAAPSPAEAGKLGSILTKAAVTGAARAGRRNGRDEDASDAGGRASNKVDPVERAAQAMAKLDAVRAAQPPPPSVATLSAPVGAPGAIVCLAGC